MLLSNILNECKENFIIDLINKFYCWTCCPVISSYIIKELKKLVSCLYGVIMHSGGCWENTREACKTLGYASRFTSFSRILSGEASLMRVVMLFRNQRRGCEFGAHGGGGPGELPWKILKSKLPESPFAAI